MNTCLTVCYNFSSTDKCEFIYELLAKYENKNVTFHMKTGLVFKIKSKCISFYIWITSLPFVSVCVSFCLSHFLCWLLSVGDACCNLIISISHWVWEGILLMKNICLSISEGIIIICTDPKLNVVFILLIYWTITVVITYYYSHFGWHFFLRFDKICCWPPVCVTFILLHSTLGKS